MPLGLPKETTTYPAPIVIWASDDSYSVLDFTNLKYDLDSYFEEKLIDKAKILFLKQKPHTSPYNPKGYWYIDDDNKILVATRQVKSGTKADEGVKPTISPPWTKPEWGTIELIIDRGQLLCTDTGVRWKM